MSKEHNQGASSDSNSVGRCLDVNTDQTIGGDKDLSLNFLLILCSGFNTKHQ